MRFPVLCLACGLVFAQAPDAAYGLLTRAYEALRARDYDTAIAGFLKGIELAPRRASIRKDLAYTYIKVGENELARDQFQEAMHIDPSDTQVALEYAFLCYETREQAEARRIFDRLRKTGNATAERAFHNIDDPLAAGIARWTQAIGMGADNFSAHFELATLAEQRIEEVPTTLSQDGRSRPPHLRSWRDGWRHLRFLLLYSPRWLFFYPGLAMLVLGLGVGAAIIPGPLSIGGVRFDVDLPDELPPVDVDPVQIGQIVYNLLTNAVQAIGRNGTITLRAGAGDGSVALRVTDSGPGIPPELRDRIFEPLFTTKARGIGLGLAVSRSLARANGGDVVAESMPGAGATFSVAMPAIAVVPT